MKLSDIQKIIKDFEKSSMTELSLEFEDTKIALSKKVVSESVAHAPMQTTHVPQELPTQVKTNDKNTIKSPLVGTFYAASSPKSKPYVEVGSKVSQGDVLCLIEAMKIMNEITAPKDGVIVKIHAVNGQVVGIDDALFDLE